MRLLDAEAVEVKEEGQGLTLQVVAQPTRRRYA